MTNVYILKGLFVCLPSVLAIKCYREDVSSSCPTTSEVTSSVSDWFHSIWKPVKDWTQGAVGENFIDNIAAKLKNQLGIDLTSHENIKEWTKNSISTIGADFDVSNNCYIVYGESFNCFSQS